MKTFEFKMESMPIKAETIKSINFDPTFCFPVFIDSRKKPLIELLLDSLQNDQDIYSGIYDMNTEKTYSFKEAERIIKLNQL